jgi:FkbM family methyltransferase
MAPWVTNAQGRRLYVDRHDHRAWRMAVRGGALDEDAVRVWGRLTELADPDLVLDIGANYGEVVLSADYPPGAEVHLVEPNPALVPLLRRSMREAGLEATIHEVAATRTTGTATLNINARTSGASSLMPGWTADRTVEVHTAPVDDLVPRGRHRCLFKIDVEGFEAEVLAGMSATLDACESWMGLVEHFGRRPPLELARVPHVYAVRRPSFAVEPATDEVLAEVSAHRGGFTKDLVLSSVPIELGDL